MKYAQLLKYLRELSSRCPSFDAQMASGFLRVVKFPGAPDEAKIPWQSLTTKRISNDLNRLYRMQLLKRKRVKRTITTKTGKECHRGYCYEYSFTKQGISYSEYLKQPWWARVIDQELSRKQNYLVDPDKLAATLAVRNMPPDSQEYALRLYEIIFEEELNRKRRGRYNRYPPKVDLPLLLYAIKQSEDSQDFKKLFSEQLDKGLANKQKMEEGIQSIFKIMEDGLSLLKLARARFAEKGDNPAIWADNTFVSYSTGITDKSVTFLLRALEWIIRELERKHKRSVMV